MLNLFQGSDYRYYNNYRYSSKLSLVNSFLISGFVKYVNDWHFNESFINWQQKNDNVSTGLDKG